jgi:hypothetical protein
VWGSTSAGWCAAIFKGTCGAADQRLPPWRLRAARSWTARFGILRLRPSFTKGSSPAFIRLYRPALEILRNDAASETVRRPSWTTSPGYE